MFSQAQLAQFRRLSADISGVDGSVSGLSNDVSGLSNDVSGLSNDVAGLSSDVDARIAAAVGVSVQAQLEFDTTPTDASLNPVTSGGVHAALAAASIGDTGWVPMTINTAKVVSGSIAYRVKNGVFYLAGVIVANASGTAALTVDQIPTECMPSEAYGSCIRVPATVTVWKIPDVNLDVSERKPVMGGVVDIETSSALGSVNVTVVIGGGSWLLPQPS